MEAVTDADDSTELRINGDVSDVTEIEARRIFNNTDYNVTVNARGSRDTQIVVFWRNDMERVNGYHKASVINEVLDSPASVKLYGTDDGTQAVTFTVRQ